MLNNHAEVGGAFYDCGCKNIVMDTNKNLQTAAAETDSAAAAVENIPVAKPVTAAQVVAAAGAQTASAAAAPSVPAAPVNATKLPLPVMVSVMVLIAAGVISVALVLLSPAQDSGVRAFATFLLFAIFVLNTLLASKIRIARWFAPLSYTVSSLVLLLGLLHTWMAGYYSYSGYYGAYLTDYSFPYDPRYMSYTSGSEIFGYLFGMCFLMCLAFWAAVLMLTVSASAVAGYPGKSAAFRCGVVSVVLLLLVSTMLALIPIFGDVEYLLFGYYSRSCVAFTLLAAMFFAVAVVLVIVNRGSAKSVRAAAQTAQTGAAPADNAEVASAVTQHVSPPTQEPQVAVASQPKPQLDENGLLPWPTFADGRPLPALPNGQPDFSVPGAPYPPHLLLDK